MREEIKLALTLSHWIYLIVIIAVIVFMICKREVIIPCLVGTFIIGLLFTKSLTGGVQTVFNSMITAGTDLFDIMLVIALMVAMLRALANMGADRLMISPATKLVKKPAVAFWVIAGVMYIAATFFWPTPATALVGTILIPIAMEAGLKPLAACMAMNLAGHGMALSGDIVLQGAPAITSTNAGIPVEASLSMGALFATIAGIVALLMAFFLNRKDILEGNAGQQTQTTVETKEARSYAKYFAAGVPLIFLLIIIRLIAGSSVESVSRIIGGDATALLGGTAALILIIATIVDCREKALEQIVAYLREGLQFAIKIFSPVIPIAGFFMLGSPTQAAEILGEGAPGLLFDLGNALAEVLPLGPIPLAIGIVVIGGITGLDGSGFSGLPLVGVLSASLAIPAGLDTAILGGLGQVGAVFVGGGCLSAWAFGAVASAGVAGVSPSDLVRKNFIPVMSGLGVSTVVAIIMLYAGR